MNKIFIFAGTTEGRLLFYKAMETKTDPVAFVVTQDGKNAIQKNAPNGMVIPDDHIRVGRLDKEAMETLFRSEVPKLIFDATHPFAREATNNIIKASQACGIKTVRVLRETEEWSDTGTVAVSDMDSALRLIETDYKNKNILFTTGSKEAFRIRDFFDREYVSGHFFFRVLPAQENIRHITDIGARQEHIITGVGPFTKEDNKLLIKKFKIDILLTKESGHAGGFLDKLNAAKECGTDIIIIKRPIEDGVSLNEACRLLQTL